MSGSGPSASIVSTTTLLDSPQRSRRPRPRRRKEAMTTTTTPQLALTRIFNAPRELLYREFTDPDRLARWWARLAMHSPATRWTSTCARRPPAMDGGLSGRSRTSRERRTRPCGGRRRRAARRRDYSLGVSLWRLGKRARSRTVQLTAEAAKTGRRAGLPDNLAAARGVLTALRSHSGQRREYTQLFAEPANQDLAMVRLRSPQAHASGWLASPLRQPRPVEGTKESILAVLAVSIDR